MFIYMFKIELFDCIGEDNSRVRCFSLSVRHRRFRRNVPMAFAVVSHFSP